MTIRQTTSAVRAATASAALAHRGLSIRAGGAPQTTQTVASAAGHETAEYYGQALAPTARAEPDRVQARSDQTNTTPDRKTLMPTRHPRPARCDQRPYLGAHPFRSHQGPATPAATTPHGIPAHHRQEQTA